MRGTKVVATLGPASDPHIEALVAEGVDVFRLNFSHGTHEDHENRIEAIRAAAKKLGRYVAILGDLQGPKVRIGKFKDDSIALSIGDKFVIDTKLGTIDGTTKTVGTTYQQLPDEVNQGDVLVLGDGEVELEVEAKSVTQVSCRVLMGGVLGGNKGINLRGGGLSVAALTSKDFEDLEFACSQQLDYIAVSFVRNGHDIRRARELALSHYCSCGIVAKLERSEAVLDDKVLDEIIKASDAVMVARGDLAIEIGDAALMGMQKHIINRARELNRTVITATQMMESMITSPKPTRAEVMDVANAVVDGTDAVMLSGETAAGCHPVQAVKQMVEIIEGAESTSRFSVENLEYECQSIDESVAMASMAVAEQLDKVKAVACLTATGNTPKLMSRRRSKQPIYALAENERTLSRVTLIRGVHPRLFRSSNIDFDHVNTAAIAKLSNDGVISEGDRVVLSKGDFRNVQGGTNTLQIMEVKTWPK